MSSTENNKELVRRIYESVINTGNLELLEDLVDNDFAGPGDLRPASELFFPSRKLKNDVLNGSICRITVLGGC